MGDKVRSKVTNVRHTKADKLTWETEKQLGDKPQQAQASKVLGDTVRDTVENRETH